MASAFFAADFSSVITSLREGMLMYVGRKPCSTSTPSSFLGRSMTCPMDAFTRKSDPRYLLIVFALAGDSTITSDLPISPYDKLPATEFQLSASILSRRQSQFLSIPRSILDSVDLIRSEERRVGKECRSRWS